MLLWILGSVVCSSAFLIFLASRNRKVTFYLVWRAISRDVNSRLRPLKERLFNESGLLSGTVVEIGPGFGETIQLYADPARITSLVLVEPNLHMHARLRSAALAAGVPPARVSLLAADAAALPLPSATADTVVCSLVLCSVADPAAAIAEILRVLRPGGRLVWIEHVAAPSGSAGAAIQRVLMGAGLWRICGDGCDLCRSTGAALRAAGGWGAWCPGPSAGWAWMPIECGVAVRGDGPPAATTATAAAKNR
jgi:SAM-dependent methyltransferase